MKLEQVDDRTYTPPKKCVHDRPGMLPRGALHQCGECGQWLLIFHDSEGYQMWQPISDRRAARIIERGHLLGIVWTPPAQLFAGALAFLVFLMLAVCV